MRLADNRRREYNQGMGEDRKKPGAGFLASIVLTVLALYPLSFGPACRLCEDGKLNGYLTWVVYRPMSWMAYRGPDAVSRAIWWWVGIFRSHDGGGPAEPLTREWHVQHPGAT